MKTLKKLLPILTAVLLCLALCAFFTGCTKKVVKSNDISDYKTDCESVKNASVMMPDIDSLGDYTDIKYTHQYTIYSVFMGFCSDGLALFTQYDKPVYDMQKEQALETYVFLTEPVRDELPLTEFEYRGYLMKVVPDEKYINFCACKSFMMIGFNDELNVIAYLYFYDFDLDYIAKADEDLHKKMQNHIDTAFKWVEF